MEESLLGTWGKASWLASITFQFTESDVALDTINPMGGSANPNHIFVQSQYTVSRLWHKWYVNGQDGYEGYADNLPNIMNGENVMQFPILLRSNCSAGPDIDESRLSTEARSEAKIFGFYVEHDLLNDIRPAAFHSTANALEGHLTTLRNNYVETIKELPEIASLVPDVGILVKALIEFDKNPYASGRDFADFLTSFILKFNFGWSPNADAVSELREAAPTIWDSFKRFTTPETKILAGKFTYELPDPYYGGCRLTVRSTLEMEYSDAEFATRILGLDSVGVLPNLHRTWEALPYSFAIDWITRMGRRLHDVDTAFEMFSCMTIHWLEHAFELRAPFPSTMDLSSIDKDRSSAELVWFQRDLSRLVPALRSSKYDFRQAHGPLNPSILASLIFQKAK
jgi:hypothetical protein